MNRLTDKRLLEHIAQLERDARDFDQRASLQKTLLERQDRFSPSDPLYQRLTSIRDHLHADLRRARGELEARRQDESSRPRWSLRSAVAALTGVRAQQ
jgi:hypothetical protein